jgi:hypothetical protein
MHKGGSKMRRRLLMGIAALLFVIIVTGVGGAEEKSGTYILNITISGAGRVVGKDITCSAVCNVILPEETEVVLTAFPAREWHFVGWDGDCKETGACRVRMDDNKAVEAIFTYP